jgi:4-amino-4-deoxy-L-arabinose transferase-like glycosyltransferase
MGTLDLDRLVAGWRGPALAALFAVLAVLPGLFASPPIDRDESRYAEASAQMLASGDYVNINFQDQPRHKKPVGIYWLQSASVALVSKVEARQIWPYRIPSLLGAALAAAACAWGAAGFFGARKGTLAGIALGSTVLMSTEGFFATTDAVLCGTATLSLAALGRLYGAAHGVGTAGFGTKFLFWLGMAAAILIKGPIGPMVAALTLIALAVWDREAGWIRRLGWLWGFGLVLLITLPWAIAITTATHGAFWGRAIGGDMASKVAGGQESHGSPPGYYLIFGLLTLFPATLLLPAALATARKAGGGGLLRLGFSAFPAGIFVLLAGAAFGKHAPKWAGGVVAVLAALVWLAVALGPQLRAWRARGRFALNLAPKTGAPKTGALAEPGVRFALCWLVPSWIVFEAAPTKLPHYVLPLYGALAWLLVAALREPLSLALRRWGAGLLAFGGVAIAAVAVYVAVAFGAPAKDPWAGATAILALAAAGVGGWLLLKGRAGEALLAACGLGALAHAALFAGLAANIPALWPSNAILAELKRHGFDPRDPASPGPAALIGYAEPSAVFLTRPDTVLSDDPADGVRALAQGRPAVVEARRDRAFRADLAQAGVRAQALETVRGFDYSNGRKVALTLYRRSP